jgi:hypothetical protein
VAKQLQESADDYEIVCEKAGRCRVVFVVSIVLYCKIATTFVQIFMNLPSMHPQLIGNCKSQGNFISTYNFRVMHTL